MYIFDSRGPLKLRVTIAHARTCTVHPLNLLKGNHSHNLTTTPTNYHQIQYVHGCTVSCYSELSTSLLGEKARSRLHMTPVAMTRSSSSARQTTSRHGCHTSQSLRVVRKSFVERVRLWRHLQRVCVCVCLEEVFAYNHTFSTPTCTCKYICSYMYMLQPGINYDL